LGCTDLIGSQDALLGDVLVARSQTLTVSLGDASGGGVGSDRLIPLGTVSSESFDPAMGATIDVESDVDPAVLGDLVGAESPRITVMPSDVAVVDR
jgi:hypothetical protein